LSDLLTTVRQRIGRGRVERRAFQRFKASIGAEVAVVLAGTQLSAPQPGVIEDISGGGVGLRTTQDFEPGANLRIAFVLPGDEQHAVCSVEVVASRSLGDEFIAHCKFVELRRTTLGWRILNWAMARERPGQLRDGSATEAPADH
jgi:hypothetical protein